MARFDVYRHAGEGFLLDCQSDLLNGLNTRFVIPLLPSSAVDLPLDRLNPVLLVAGEPHVLVAQLAGAVLVRELGALVFTLGGDADIIVGAIDLLVTGV